MALFTAREGDASGVTLERGGGPPTFADGSLQEPGTARVLEFEAASWNEARRRQYDHYGWGRYEPQPDREEIGPDEA